jgi:hypothetical protein
MTTQPTGRWRKSGRCGANAGCVEVAPVWRKATASMGANDACVEVAAVPPSVAIRDSKLTCSPVIVVGAAQWRALLGAVKGAQLFREVTPDDH